jgi:hypothetical protein
VPPGQAAGPVVATFQLSFLPGISRRAHGARRLRASGWQRPFAARASAS